jgi:hypothetical protein
MTAEQLIPLLFHRALSGLRILRQGEYGNRSVEVKVAVRLHRRFLEASYQTEKGPHLAVIR